MNKLILIPVAVLMLATVISCESTQKVQNLKLENASDSLSYAIGYNIGQSFKEQKLTEVDPQLMAVVINAILADDTAGLKMDGTTSVTFIQGYMQKKQEMEDAKAKEEGIKYLEENAKKSGVKVTPSGVQYEVITAGNGKTPVDGDNVTIHYTGTFVDGKEFDSSVRNGQPVTYPVNGFTPGFSEALKMMKEGDKWRVVIPSDLAYGPAGFQGVIPPNAVLIFELELLKVSPATK